MTNAELALFLKLRDQAAKVVPTEARTYTDRPSATDAELGFMARRRALCFLPRTNPGDQPRGVPANTPANRLLAVAQPSSPVAVPSHVGLKVATWGATS